MFNETCIATIILLGVAVSGLAEKRPDFSGEWILNREASTHKGGRTVSSLRWDGNTLVVMWRTERSDGETTVSFRSELVDGGRRLRAVEQLRGTDHDQENVWIFERR